MTKPVSVSEWFAWACRGRLSSLRGLAGVAFGAASFIASWPLVVVWCRTRGPQYREFVGVTLFMLPFMFWAVWLRGMNCKLAFGGYDPSRAPWWRKRASKS